MNATEKLLKTIHDKFVSNNITPNETVIGNWLSLNGVTTHTGADKDYRKLNAYSNSRLSEIKNQLMGIRKPKPLKAFSMGSILHQLILEPELAEAEDYVFLTPAPRRHMRAAKKSAKKSALKNRLLKRVLGGEGTEVEKVVRWTDAEYGVDCKAKVDIAYEDRRGLHVIDIKSTGERTKAAFIASCRKYEYERQAAFYLDGTGAETVVIYGIQKLPPYGVFRKRYTRKELEEGRWKYRFILGKAVGMDTKGFDLSPGLKGRAA